MDEGFSSYLWDRIFVPCAVRMRSVVCMRSVVRMRSTESCEKTFLKRCLRVKIKCVKHEPGYSSNVRALALQARGSEIKTLCFQKIFSTIRT